MLGWGGDGAGRGPGGHFLCRGKRREETGGQEKRKAQTPRTHLARPTTPRPWPREAKTLACGLGHEGPGPEALPGAHGLDGLLVLELD